METIFNLLLSLIAQWEGQDQQPYDGRQTKW
jgi:hypothetical protein